jgi:hypothetical protein
MPRNLETVDIPLTGGGEQSAAAPGEFGPGEAWRLENGWVVGKGIVAQVGDWRLASTCTDQVGTPMPAGVECCAVLGVFPFSQVGGLGGSATSGGVAFALQDSADKIILYHLNEDGKILRAIDTFAQVGTWTLSNPPQITGFEMKGRFYFCWNGRETAATSRKGLAYYDPSGAGSIVKPTFNIEGAGASALLFKGISLHQGGTILGWGYDKVGSADAPHLVRYCKYGDPDTFIAAASDDDITAGKFPVGTLSIPVIGCAQSGQYTVIGKEREIFALDGNYSSQFNLRPIGNSHGPVSTTGIVSIGDAAVWMAEDGPVVSRNGGNVEQIGVDKILRRFLTYFDLTYACAAHDSTRNRVGWLLKRQYAIDGTTISKNWGDEILFWDYQRDLFYVERTPETCFSIGTLKGTGQILGPSAAPSGAAASSITADAAVITWMNGDTFPGVTTTLEYRVNGDPTWIVASPAIGSGTTSFLLTGLLGGTTYDIRLTHHRNGLSSASATSVALFVTGVHAPFNLQALNIGQTSVTINWQNGEVGTYTTTLGYKKNGDANWLVASTTIVAGDINFDLTGLVQGAIYDIRVRHVKNGLASDFTSSAPLFTTSGALLANPTLLAASGITGGVIQVNWSNGDKRKQTRVQYKKTQDANWITHATAPPEILDTEVP